MGWRSPPATAARAAAAGGVGEGVGGLVGRIGRGEPQASEGPWCSNYLSCCWALGPGGIFSHLATQAFVWASALSFLHSNFFSIIIDLS